jgi:arylsulfatase A-like enzyme
MNAERFGNSPKGPLRMFRKHPDCLKLLLGPAAFSTALMTAHPAPPSELARPNILFCLADDWAWPHAGAYGDRVVKTPVFDGVARQGFLFTHAFSAAPSCTASRAAMLTGQAPHRLQEGANLHCFLPSRFAVYPDLLEQAGYFVGHTGKGWGPGNIQAGGRTRNPAGPQFKSFDDFLKQRPEGKPFCFWFGGHDPHRPYDPGSGLRAGMKLEDVSVPPYLPDTPEVRSDILDYYFEVDRFDRDVGEVLRRLEATGQASNTLVVISGDNGWPFPRSKANLYDSGTRQPLALRWPARFKKPVTIETFVNLTDLAPTFLEAAGLRPPADMTGKSWLGWLPGKPRPAADVAFMERERHANVRVGDLSYPSRAVRTREFLYIRNFRPDRWPAGDPEMFRAVGEYGDCDNSPSKTLLLEKQGKFGDLFQAAFGKRPAEELYDVRKDPHQLVNLAGPAHSRERQRMRALLDAWMKRTADPRSTVDDDRWDHFPYFGAARRE